MVKLDIRSIPDSFLKWPAAYRLKPARVPADHALKDYGEDEAALDELIGLTAPTGRWQDGKIALEQGTEIGTAPEILEGFANPYPEWRFNPRSLPHMVVGDTIEAAVAFISEIYEAFLRDTNQPPCRMNFLLERYTLEGSFKDVTDREVFPACYSMADHSVSQQVVVDVAGSGNAGLLYEEEGGTVAVITQAKALKWHGQERAVVLDWDGARFTRMFDYRGLYWRDIGTKK
ncbi:hypothetical protein [Kordiimonas laminariae]|uniref:hypothetical protein n=1 Tax=Kordiimonas laminariae TaxID=2917717 RepID=UPI001FF6C171|nr:hypothetical protein [Kordiimonas laminariae]MCK0070797.1 hypothetical protein [Kordiimonas laminariae]